MRKEISFEHPQFRELLEKITFLFSEFGIRNLNMDDISRNLGISKKTLYLYFKSKEDLIEKLFCYDHLKWEEQFAEILKEPDLNAIEVLFKVSLHVYQEMEKLDAKLRFELKKYYEPSFRQFLTQKHNSIFNKITENLLRGIREGLYRNDLNVELTAGLYVRNLIDLHQADFCFFENITYEQLFTALFEGHIRAIATPDGIAYAERRKQEIQKEQENIFHN